MFAALAPARDLRRRMLVAAAIEIVIAGCGLVHVLVTGADVIHSFAVPSFGIKIDAVPGRLNDTWFKAWWPGLVTGKLSDLADAAAVLAGRKLKDLTAPVIVERDPRRAYALAARGEAGVTHALDLIAAEMRVAVVAVRVPVGATQVDLDVAAPP